MIEALLDSGRVLCHVVRGEIRVPLAQVEAFFRDALIRTYQAEAGGEFGVLNAGSVSDEPAPPPELPTHNAQPLAASGEL